MPEVGRPAVKPKLRLTGRVFWSYGEDLGLQTMQILLPENPMEMFGGSALVLITGDGRKSYEMEEASRG